MLIMKKIIPLFILPALVLYPVTVIAAQTSTMAFQVAQERGIYAENENALQVCFYADDNTKPLVGYVIADDTADLRIEIEAQDNPEAMVLSYIKGETTDMVAVNDLLDPDRGVFIYDCPMPDPSEDIKVTSVILSERENEEKDPDITETILISGEEYIGQAATVLEEKSKKKIRWEVVDPVKELDKQPACIMHVVDQNNEPVPDVYAIFCTDMACSMAVSDSDGMILFDGEPDNYHVQLLELPDGYSFDPDFSMYTSPDHNEWVLRIWKND